MALFTQERRNLTKSVRGNEDGKGNLNLMGDIRYIPLSALHLLIKNRSPNLNRIIKSEDRFLSFSEIGYDILQILCYREVLRTYALALPALNAVTCLSGVLDKAVIILALRSPSLFRDFQAVHIIQRKNSWNLDSHRTAGHAVFTAGAWNGDRAVDDVNGLHYN